MTLFFLFIYATTVIMYERELDAQECIITCEDIESIPDQDPETIRPE